MKLYNIKVTPPVLLAEFDDSHQVKFLHPLLKRSIEIQRGAVIPAITKLTEQFNGLTRISSSDPKFGKALVIQLTFDYASHPDTYKWLNGDALNGNQSTQAS
jgi:hypothetical protein